MLFAVWCDKLDNIPQVLDRFDTVTEYEGTSKECTHGVDRHKNEEKQDRFVIKKRIREPADANGYYAGNELGQKYATGKLVAVFGKKVHMLFVSHLVSARKCRKPRLTGVEAKGLPCFVRQAQAGFGIFFVPGALGHDTVLEDVCFTRTCYPVL